MKKIYYLLLLISGISLGQNVIIPDASFKQALLFTAYAEDAMGIPVFQIDADSNGEIDYAEAAQIVKLYVDNSSITDLTGIEAFVNLYELSCADNQIQTLALQSMPALNYINCPNNALTYLDVSGLSALQVIYFDNNPQLAYIDLSGCAQLTSINQSDNALEFLKAANCPNLLSLSVNSSNLTYLNFDGSTALNNISIWFSQLGSFTVADFPALDSIMFYVNPMLSSLEISNCPSLTTLNCSSNQLTALDVSSLVTLTSLNCAENLLTTLDVSNLSLLTSLVCIGNQLETLFIKNGQNEFLSLGNNPNLGFVCADAAQLSNVQQLLNSEGLVNAVCSSYCSFTPGGDYNTFTGTVRYDSDGNGCGGSDFAVPFLKIDVTADEGFGSVYTDQNGNYTEYTAGNGVMLHPNFENSNYFVMFLPVALDFPAPNSTIVQNFCVVPDGIHPDLEIVVAPVVAARPGFAAVYKIVYKNKGNQVMSQPLGVSFGFDDSKMDFVSADVAPNQQTAGQLAWSFANLFPFESRSIEITMQINAPTHPTDPVNVGDRLLFTAAIQPLAGDDMPADNAFALPQTVFGSYDPNNLICLEGDVVSTAMIGEYLHYIANFENTGTDAAVNIVVKTVFDPAQVDVNSLRILGSSDPVQIRVNGNTAEYIFQDINLAIGGHGNILLKIKSNNSLVSGDSVLNKADIYFDYNLPITTNDAETTYQMLRVPAHGRDNSISVSPNPSSGPVHIAANTQIKSIELYDIQGRLLQVGVPDAVNATLDLTPRQSGVYFVKVQSEKGSSVEKVIKK